MEIKIEFPSIYGLINTTKILMAVTKRSLIVDLRYRFQLVIEATWTAINVGVFVLLGAAWQQTADVTGVPYSMITFFIIATGFFTVISGVMESTVTAITEENQMGTMGFLVTQSVSPIAIIIGRYLAASVRWLIIMILIVIPPIIIKGVYPSTWELLSSSLLIFFIAWFFMLGFTLVLTSVALIFKRTSTFNRVMIYVVRFASGAFVPLNSFDNMELFNRPLSNYLIWFPPAYALESLRWLFTIDSRDQINCTSCVSKDELTFRGFDATFGTYTSSFSLSDPMVQKMILVVIIFLFISLILVEKITTVARRWGTIEFY